MIDEREIKPHIPLRVPDRSGCEIRIADAFFPVPFQKGLVYAPPARGTWTIAHSPMLIPGCHEIYVCCSCCLQGVVLTADEIPDGGNERFSMVTLTNENILKGDLEDMMIEGVSAILDEMETKPHLVECFTSCVQHFLHIDLKVVYRTLKKRYPDTDFLDGYMIPTLARKLTPDMLGRRQLMRAAAEKRLERTAAAAAAKQIAAETPAHRTSDSGEMRDRAVSLLVNYYPTDPDSELAAMLRAGGYEVRDFASCQTYEDYLALADSACALYYLPNAKPAVDDLKKRTGMDNLYLPYSYNFSEIRAGYQQLAESLQLPLPDCAALEQKCRDRAAALLSLIGDTKIALDYTASPRILSLARFLLENGFRVTAVYTDAMTEEEEEDFHFLQNETPDLVLRATRHFKMRLLPRDEGTREMILAIGQKAAYFTGTDHFVNMVENGAEIPGTGQICQLFGYSGILHVLDLMEEAFRASRDVRRLIEVKAYGCTGRLEPSGAGVQACGIAGQAAAGVQACGSVKPFAAGEEGAR